MFDSKVLSIKNNHIQNVSSIKMRVYLPANNHTLVRDVVKIYPF